MLYITMQGKLRLIIGSMRTNLISILCACTVYVIIINVFYFNLVQFMCFQPDINLCVDVFQCHTLNFCD